MDLFCLYFKLELAFELAAGCPDYHNDGCLALYYMVEKLLCQ